MQLFEQAPTSDELVAFIDTQSEPVRVRDISKHFGIKASKAKGSAYSQLRTLLRDLVAAGEIAKTQARPNANHFYHSIPQTVAAVQQEQEGEVIRFKVGLRPAGPAIGIDELKMMARRCEDKRSELQNEVRKLNTEITELCHRIEVLLILIEPFDENFRLGLH